MIPDRLVAGRRESVIAECARRLGRRPTPKEEEFVTSCGFQALETLESTVGSLTGKVLEAFLNSGPQK